MNDELMVQKCCICNHIWIRDNICDKCGSRTFMFIYKPQPPKPIDTYPTLFYQDTTPLIEYKKRPLRRK